MRITQGVIGSAAISILALMTPSSITVAQDSLSLPAQKQTVSTESAEIAFYETGNPDGRPVLFVHGMPVLVLHLAQRVARHGPGRLPPDRR